MRSGFLMRKKIFLSRHQVRPFREKAYGVRHLMAGLNHSWSTVYENNCQYRFEMSLHPFMIRKYCIVIGTCALGFVIALVGKPACS